eukprot:TRINITY_DN4689_c0_g1_i5.p1 TRINITY_DN4689_c0_g1~~TRINITY_DN4689_c0_g1_i5.p1  ORF type:complete len:255 (-),score=78.43 TRINITY_DN4689_c0_g1_i5:159-923(-)
MPMNICLSFFLYFPNMQKYCLYQIPASAWTEVTDAEVATLNPDSCSGIVNNQFHALPNAALNGFIADCVKQFDTTNCAGIHDLGSFNEDAFSGFQKYCIYQIPSTSFKNVSGLQMKNVLDAACGGFTSDQFKTIPSESYAGFEPGCVENFATDQCTGITSLGGFDSKSMDGFSKYCLYQAPSSAFTTLTKDHTSQITVTATSGIRQSDFAQIPAIAYGGFTHTNVAGFSASDCVGIPLLGSFDVNAISGLSVSV